jgi:mannosylglycoprotein endo-beta-mannosidase
VLQYADDTLIIVRATPTAAQNLKEILDNFALATGLSINFDKTTLVPMNVPTNLAASIATTLGTHISSFPQTYLGLPLSATKLPPSAFQPIIDNCDRYLAGWRATLLSKGGRLVLLSAVLDALPTYFMSSFLIPISVITTIDARRRAFFWAAEETCTGAQCLVAWDKLCVPTSRGGLGAKNLKAQNVCLLLKFCFKFLHSQNLPWKQWILSQTTNPFAASNPSYLTKTIAKHLDTLLQITTCTANNGKSVLFWHDKWLLPETLATAFPALYSHHTHTHAFVCDILQNDISAGLRCRLTNAAS